MGELRGAAATGLKSAEAARFLFNLAFLSDSPFFPPRTLSTSPFLLQAPLVIRTPSETSPTFPMLFVPPSFFLFFFYFKLQGRRIKAQVVSTSASVFVTLFQPPLPCPPVFLLGQLVPLSGVTAEKADRKERGHGNGEQRQETKEGRVQALK